MGFIEEQQLESAYVMGTYARKPVELVRGRGMRVEDAEGRTYLDFVSGVGAVSLGHCHPALVSAIEEQASTLVHVSNYYYIEHRGEVAHLVSDLLNECVDEAEREPWQSFFANSGAEANECAFKLARLHAKKRAMAAAEAAGADVVGSDDLVAQVQAGELNFDAAIATPNMMGKVDRLGKILGPRGLMPNPKLGTVTNDVAKAINELKGGRVEYRADRYGIAHVILGKVSFTAEQLAENYGAVYDEILRMKPAAAKGKYVKSITVSSTMSPGVKVDPSVNRNYTEPAAE